MPTTDFRPMLLVTFNQPYDGLVNGEFSWISLVSDLAGIHGEILRLLGGSVQWRRIVESWALSRDVDLEIDELRRCHAGLLIWFIEAQANPVSTQREATAICEANTRPDWEISNTSQVDALIEDLRSKKVLA